MAFGDPRPFRGGSSKLSMTLIRCLLEGTIPAHAGIDRGSKECGFCSYHTLCWGERKAVPWDRRPHLETGDPELVLAAET